MSTYEIPLGYNKFAIIDKDDLEFVMRHQWRCANMKSRFYYATMRKSRDWKDQKMHNYLMNCPDDMVVDHKNGNGLDNRRSNLRICTPHQNNWNHKKMKGTVNKFKGVSKRSEGSYVAAIRYNHKLYRIGSFKTEEEAAIAYNKKAYEFHGEFANMNESVRYALGVSFSKPD